MKSFNEWKDVQEQQFGPPPPQPPAMTDRMSQRRGREIADDIMNNGHIQRGLRDIMKIRDKDDNLKQTVYKVLSQRIDDILRQYLMK